MNKTAAYPEHYNFIERLGKKVLTRIVSDGIALDDAIKEAIHLASLNTQQIFHLCSVLEDYGQVFNGDQKNYFFTSENMGKAFPGTENGYVVYAGVNGKNSKIKEVFKTVEALKKQGFSDQDILAINNDLQEVLSVINEFSTDYKTLVSDFEASKNKANEQTAPEQKPISNRDKSFLEKGKDWVGEKINNLIPQPAMMGQPANADFNYVIAQLNNNAEVEEATPENVEKIKSEEEIPNDELNFSEEDPINQDLDFEEDDLGGKLKATITPTPDELMAKIKNAPKWEVQNILSMQKAENFFKDLQKELEAVAYNPNILMDAQTISKYDKVRAAIEADTNKISEAQKGVDKLEKKENELQDKYENPNEAPTEDIIAEEPVIEETTPNKKEENINQPPVTKPS